MWEYVFSVVWDSDPVVIAEIEKRLNVVRKIPYQPKGIENRRRILAIIYPKTKPVKDSRLTKNTPITILLIKDISPIYGMRKRAEGILPCNLKALETKQEIRKLKSFLAFHMTDHVDEANDVIRAFGFKLKHPFTLLKLPFAKAMLVNPPKGSGEFVIVDLQDTPHWMMLEGYPDAYRSYVANEDPNPQHTHSVFSKLNDELTPESYYSSDTTVCVKMHGSKMVIKDGVHRACILGHKWGLSAIKVLVQPIQLRETQPQEHHIIQANKFVVGLQRLGIRFCVIRGADTLPRKPNTDLDVTIEESRYGEAIELAQSMLRHCGTRKEGLTNYASFRTTAPPCAALPNQCFQFDLYSRTAFFLSSRKHVVSPCLEQLILDTVVYCNNYPICVPGVQLLLTMYRAVYDKGKFKETYAAQAEACTDRAGFEAACEADGVDSRLWELRKSPEAIFRHFEPPPGSVLLLIRGDMYRGHKGESVGKNIEEQHRGLKTIQKHIVDPLVSQGHSVKIIIHVFCVESMQEIARAELNEFLGNPLIVFVKVRQPTQHHSVLDMATTHLEIMNQHDHVAMVRVDLLYHMDLFPTGPLSTQKLLTICPHLFHNWTNDAFVCCPRMHLDAFVQYLKDRDPDNNSMHQLPELFPVMFTTNTRYNTSSESGYVPFYHHIGRPIMQQRDDFNGEIVRTKQRSDNECVLLVVYGIMTDILLGWMRTWVVEPLRKRGYDIAVIVHCSCEEIIQETMRGRIYSVFDGLPLKISLDTEEIRLRSILGRNGNRVSDHDFTVAANINLCCDKNIYPNGPLPKTRALILGNYMSRAGQR